MAKAVKTKTELVTAKRPSRRVKRRSAIIKPIEIGADVQFDPERQLQQARSPRAQALSQAQTAHTDSHVLSRLWSIIELRRAANPALSHSAQLLGAGTAQVAQKFGEEAVECLIEIVAGNRTAAIAESADVLYHLLVMWVAAGIRPEEVWLELEKREGASNLVAGPKGPRQRLLSHIQLGTSKIP